MNSHQPIAIPAEPLALAESYDESARGRARLAITAAAILAGLVLFGAFLVPIGGAVIATAEIAPETRIKRIAHPTGGVIEEILVADGDRVEKGDLLIRLDAQVSSVNAEFSERSLAQLLAQRARLSAEVADLGAIRFPAELLNDRSDDAREAIRNEARRFELNRAEQSNLRLQLDERVNQLNRQIDGYRAQIGSLEAQQRLIQPELEMVRELHGQGYVTIRRLNEMERTAIDLDGSIGSLRASIARANAGIAEAQEKRIQVGQTARTRASADLARVESAINAQRVASASA
ncbi:MAG: biotin/lipoyl-binding protein, partial [Hoeflea sp.]